ncbi:LysR family transcriptional regulator [Bordetella sp. LUAb4]|uniref:LysR family transcriptional regulator n=1 Tax=Bordetella sp. LUAb4 TaxID=2843195 RepID=UPI001E5B371C|nr:LysR family transcriptional regulator [Bordetella sp. LUAb4]
MDLKQLEYFVHVAELGSFTRAAAILDVAQPALSRQVRRLEIELRQTLLYRNGRGVSVTEAGKRLLTHGRGILLQFERARQEVEDARGSPVGRIVIGVPHSIGRLITAPFVAEFKSAFPRASLCITEGLTVHLHEWLLAGRIDVAVLHDPMPSPSLEFVPLREDPLFLIERRQGRRSASSAPIPLKALADIPLIIPSRPHPMRMLVETRLANMGKKISVALEIDAVGGIVDLVMQGFGHAIVTLNALLIGPDAAKLNARRIISPRMSSVLALATSAERPATALGRQTAELMQKLLPQTLDKSAKAAAFK